MTFEEIKEIILEALATVGGVAGLVAIITSIAKIVSAAKSGKTVAKYTSAVRDMKTQLLSELQNSLNCSLDVDISAKLNDVLEKLEAQYVQKAQSIDEKLEVMRELSVEMTKLMSTSRKITEDKRAELNSLIERANGVVTAAEVEVKPKVQISLGTSAASGGTSTAAMQTVKHKITV